MADNDKTPRGLHDVKEGPAKVENYPERSYYEALSDEHRKVLEEAGQLPPKPSKG